MSNFVDEAQIHVKGGNGGAGSVSFRREAHVPKGGPDGGDGGKGGDVWFEADHNLSSLLAFKDFPHRAAEAGTHGAGKGKHGKRGEDITVAVPEGTVVLSRDGEVLAELVTRGQRWLAAAGGQAGHGNTRFLSNSRRAPAFAEQGEVGEEHYFNLELKLMADVALVGFPNVGKSTLISRISRAKPKIANYPFTTLEPHLGVVKFHEHEFVMADIPGLIEGASEGKGLGHRFLRHVERARVLLVLLDQSDLAPHEPDEQLRILLDELGRYEPELLERPRLIAASKQDAVAYEAGVVADLAFSAITGEGLDALQGSLARLVAETRASEPQAEEYVLHRPEPAGATIERDGGVFVIVGKQAERAVALSDLTTFDALSVVHKRLVEAGVMRSLHRVGARRGDVVRIGKFEFDYEPDETGTTRV